jgi:nitroreductase/NAD-dependent dihydropyrimidine dehydrogenase PreA subunit
MEYLIVDETKCKKDGICAQECPTTVIQIRKDNGYPEIAPEGFCMVCGHCVAVCPHGALSHEQILAEDSPVIKAELVINEEQAVQFLRSRRSIRRYQDKPVEKEKIRRLVEAARYAPTGANMQLVEWLVLSDKSHLRSIAGLTVDWMRQVLKDPRVAAASPYLSRLVSAWEEGHDSVLRGAPVLVVASAPSEAINGLVDLTLALSYLDLLAPTMGLGTCWAGLLQGALLASPSIKAAVGIPAGHSHHYALMLGYPDVKYYRLPKRKTPKITFK